MLDLQESRILLRGHMKCTDGTFTLENGGVSGPLTSTARTRNVDGGAPQPQFHT